MYHGEVNVAQEELNSFLAVAEELQVKGLTQNNSPSNSNTKSEPPPAAVPRPRPPPREPEAAPPAPKRARPVPAAPAPSQPAYQPSQPDDIQEITPLPVVKTEPQPALYPAVSTQGGFGEQAELMNTMGTEVASMEESYVEEGYDDYGGYEGQGYDGGDGQGYGGHEYRGDGGAGQQGVSNYVLKTESGFTCAECGKQFSDQSNCRRHVKEKHFGAEQDSCPVCNKVISRRNLPRHVKICIVQK